MTTTVTVKARAHGALVTLRAKGNAANAQEFKIPGNTSRDFHIDANHIIEVAQPEALADGAAENPTPFEGEEVPGRAENDALIAPIASTLKDGHLGEHAETSDD